MAWSQHAEWQRGRAAVGTGLGGAMVGGPVVEPFALARSQPAGPAMPRTGPGGWDGRCADPSPGATRARQRRRGAGRVPEDAGSASRGATLASAAHELPRHVAERVRRHPLPSPYGTTASREPVRPGRTLGRGTAGALRAFVDRSARHAGMLILPGAGTISFGDPWHAWWVCPGMRFWCVGAMPPVGGVAPVAGSAPRPPPVLCFRRARPAGTCGMNGR
jgi:hypothetical protein